MERSKETEKMAKILNGLVHRGYDGMCEVKAGEAEYDFGSHCQLNWARSRVPRDVNLLGRFRLERPALSTMSLQYSPRMTRSLVPTDLF